MIRPILLIGMNRSGTKWVSNIICSHDDVIGVQSERTGGILETNMFGKMQSKFDLAYPEEYIGLVELWAATEFFKRTGVDKQMFYEMSPRPRNALQLFGLLMNEYARRNNKTHWLQKLPPWNAHAVLEHFTDARIVVVRRKPIDTLRSTVGLQSKMGNPTNLPRAVRHYAYQSKLLDRICRRYPVIEMDYERLRADIEGQEARLFAELGLVRPRPAQAPSFPRNTSFASDEQRRDTMSSRSGLLVGVLVRTLGLIPFPILAAVFTIRRFFGRGRPRPLVTDTFGELGDRLADRSRGEREVP